MSTTVPTRPGKYRCPQCSEHRHNKRDKSLSVSYADGELLFKCHHCGWAGKVGEDRGNRIDYTKPNYRPTQNPTEKLFQFFLDRDISRAVVKRNQIETTDVKMPQTGKTERAIAFPFFRQGKIVNVKYRTMEKLFRMETGAEIVFYGLDDVDNESVVIVEGEMDKLAVETAGILSCVSVPNGAGTNLNILANTPEFDSVKKFVIAGDTDEPGRKLEAELIRRLGAERCWRVEWPDDCKDANDVLLRHGHRILRNLIDSAKPVPIEGVFQIGELQDDLIRLFTYGRLKGADPGWTNVREIYKPRLGQWSVITGSPGSGKSSFVRALLVNLALTQGWLFAVFAPEDTPPVEYVSQLIEIYLGKPFDEGPTPRMTLDEMTEAAEWVGEHFVIVNPVDTERDFESILTLARAMVRRMGINGLVIDPWNEVEHVREPNVTETQYVEQQLVRVRAFTALNGIHTWIVAHPAKLRKEDGKYPVPTLYDIAGSAAWFNKPDFGLSIWRDKNDDTKPVEIHTQKVRSRWCGRLGKAELFYDRVTGRYGQYRDEIPGTARAAVSSSQVADRGWLPYKDSRDDDDMEPIG